MFRKFYKVLAVLMFVSCSQKATNEQETEVKQDSVTQDITALLVDTTKEVSQKPKKAETRKPSEVRVFELKKCDIEIVSHVSRNTESVDLDLIRKFLFTFGEECSNNAEYSQYSNEILFKVMDYRTAELLEALADEKIDLDYILRVITQPIHDGIDAKKLYAEVSELDSQGEIKDAVLESLQVAIDRH